MANRTMGETISMLRKEKGLTQQETGQALGLSTSAVIRRLRAAEAILKQSLTGGEDDEA